MPRKKTTSAKPKNAKAKGSKPTDTMPSDVSPILSQLSVGAMINISQNGNNAFVAMIGEPQAPYGIAMGPSSPGQGTSEFIITAYAFDGNNEAKFSLQPVGMEGQYWIAGQNAVSLPYPILLGPSPGQFLITDRGQGFLSIQTTFSPPPPFIQAFSGGILTYGHAAPLIQGLFQIEVIG